MPHTLHVVCDTTEFDARVTVPEDALVRDVLAEAGLTDPLALLNSSSMYYRGTQPVSVSILLPVAQVPCEKTLFVHERS